MNKDATLFQTMQFGPYQLQNHIAMAPLTRSRALPGDIPNSLAIEYYAQRATAGLLIAEATQISQQGKGYVFTREFITKSRCKPGKKLPTPCMQKVAEFSCNYGMLAASATEFCRPIMSYQ